MSVNLDMLFTRYGFTPVADSLREAIKNEICIGTALADEDDIPTGASKLGGLPDLPYEAAWPVYQGKSMAFVGQISLADVAPHDTDRMLPATGLLSFYYDQDGDWVSSKTEGQPEGCRVLYYPDGVTLQRRNWPADLPDDLRFHNCSLSFCHNSILPADEINARFQIEPDQQLSDDDFEYGDMLFSNESYMNLFIDFRDSTVNGYLNDECYEQEYGNHSLLGYYMPLQPFSLGDDCREWVRLIHGQAAITDSSQFEGESWHLLATFDSDTNTDMIWADMGKLYFFISDEDLRRQRFDRVWYFKMCF